MTSLATMQDNFKSFTSGLGAVLTDEAIKNRLDDFYRYVIPADIDGRMTQRLDNTVTNTTLSFASMAPDIVGVPGGFGWFTDDGSFIPITHDSVDLFYAEYSVPVPADVKRRPQAMCLYNGVLFFDCIPDQAYTITMLVRACPSTATLSSAGIDNFSLAQAVVHGAAWHYLLEKEDEAGAQREGQLYTTFRSHLLTYSHATPQHRNATRSF